MDLIGQGPPSPASPQEMVVLASTPCSFPHFPSPGPHHGAKPTSPQPTPHCRNLGSSLRLLTLRVSSPKSHPGEQTSGPRPQVPGQEPGRRPEDLALPPRMPHPKAPAPRRSLQGLLTSTLGGSPNRSAGGGSGRAQRMKKQSAWALPLAADLSWVR